MIRYGVSRETRSGALRPVMSSSGCPAMGAISRTQGNRHIPRHCERSEAIRKSLRGDSLDCFAALAMTRLAAPAITSTFTTLKYVRSQRDGIGPLVLVLFHVKQLETTAPNWPPVSRETEEMEQGLFYNEGLALLSNAEFLKDGAEDIFNVHSAQEPA